MQIGSGYLDYGARMYMPEIGRWGVVDPLSEVTAGQSPFMYGNGNPVLMIDPSGMLATYNWLTNKYQDSHGGTVGFEEVKKEYGIGQDDGNKNCCPDSPNVKAAQAKNNNGVQGRFEAAGWKPGQAYPAIDGIETDLTIESVVIPLAKPVAWLAKPLAGLIRAQWLASIAGKSANKGVSELSTVLLRTNSQLQKKFMKHGADFGVFGKWNPTKNVEFSAAIHQHINTTGVRMINGTYQGKSVIHYVNPSTGLNVISSPNGNFISDWKLNPAQLTNVLTRGSL